MSIRKKKDRSANVTKKYVNDKVDKMQREIIQYIDTKFNELSINSNVDLSGITKVNELKIISARYGAGGKWKDITKELNEAIFEGCICVPSCNFIAGDPAPGKVKTMEVKYEINGETKEENIREGELFLIE
jgi:hypothetical protein